MEMKDILSLNGGYLIVNKNLIKKLGADAAVMISELCAEYDYYTERQKLDNEGYFYSTLENVEDSIGLKPKKQEGIVEKLKYVGFISIEKKGTPCKRHFKVNDKILEEFLVNCNANDKIIKKTKLDCRNTPNKLSQTNQQINNNIIKNKEINNKDNNMIITRPLSQAKEACEVLPYPELKDIDKELKLRKYEDIEEETKRIIMHLERVVYDYYQGRDEEMILLIYNWLIEICLSGRGIRKSELKDQLAELAWLDREQRIANIKICILNGYHNLAGDYTEYKETHPDFLEKFDRLQTKNSSPDKKPVDNKSSYTNVASSKQKYTKPYYSYGNKNKPRIYNPNDRYWGETPKCTKAELSDEEF